MKRLLTFILILAVAFVGVGFYQGWFTTSTTEAGGKSVSWNPGKFKEDMAKFSDKAKSAGKSIANKVKGVGEKVGDNQRDVEGTVTAIDTVDRLLTITPEGGEPMVMPYAEGVDVTGLEGKVAVARLDVNEGIAMVRSIEAKK